MLSWLVRFHNVHQSFVTMLPPPHPHREGPVTAGKLCQYFTFVASPQCSRVRGVCFCAKIAGITAERDQIVEVLPTICPHSAGVLAGIRWKKRESPAVSQG